MKSSEAVVTLTHPDSKADLTVRQDLLAMYLSQGWQHKGTRPSK